MKRLTNKLAIIYEDGATRGAISEVLTDIVPGFIAGRTLSRVDAVTD